MPTISLPLLLEVGYWFNGQPGPPSPITYALIVVFVLLFLGGLAVWLRRRRLFPGQRVKTRLAAWLGPWWVGISATGLILLLLRVAQFPILSGRILWLLCLIALLGIAMYVAWYMLRRYPAEMAELARIEERQRYTPKPRQRRGGGKRRR